MTIGHFIWTDLSSYDTSAAHADYGAFFGWTFHPDSGYSFAFQDGCEVAAVFAMPSRLADMNMPSFWMSYVHVEDIDVAVGKARRHDGAVIEVEPQAFNGESRVALVRDPSGAGFTLYEGPDTTPAVQRSGTVECRYHHVSDIELIREFYRDLFGWRFVSVADQPWPRYEVRHADGSLVAWVEEVAATVRGKFNYWMPCFGVDSMDEFSQLIQAHEGTRTADLPGDRAMFADRQGAHFIVRASQAAAPGDSPASPSPRLANAGLAWKALLGLICVWLAVLLDIQAFWGILFLIWTWPAIRTGRAYFIEPVNRNTQPVIYWALVGTWVVLSVWLIAASIGSYA